MTERQTIIESVSTTRINSNCRLAIDITKKNTITISMIDIKVLADGLFRIMEKNRLLSKKPNV